MRLATLSRNGLGAATMDATVTNPATAPSCCSMVGGTLNGDTCTLPTLPGLEWYCAVPFISSLFSDCDTTTGPGGAISQPVASAYTNFQTCQQSGVAAGQTAVDTSNDIESSLPQNPCSYDAAANYPNLSNILGANVTAMLTNPAASGCTDDSPFPGSGFVLYVVLGIAGFVLLSTLMSKSSPFGRPGG